MPTQIRLSNPKSQARPTLSVNSMKNKQELLTQFDEARGDSERGSSTAIVLLAVRVLLIVLIDIRDVLAERR